MTVLKDLPLTSSLGLSVDLTILSGVDPIPHAIADLPLSSVVAQVGFGLDLGLASSVGVYAGRGGRYRRRGGPMVRT